MKCLLSLVVAAALLLTMSLPAFAQGYPWEDSLRRQLQEDRDCELSYLTGIREFELQGRKTINARAHCADKRAFDISRDARSKKFELQSCLVESC